jgi:hypothetical protein
MFETNPGSRYWLLGLISGAPHPSRWQYPVNQHESFSDSICEEQMRLAERELFSFIAAVTEMYGPDQSMSSVEDWLEELEELEFMDSPARSEFRNWHAVTIAASVRLASRVNLSAVSLGHSTCSRRVRPVR